MNQYDHEDAFRDANLCAGRKVKLSDALKNIYHKDQAGLIIKDCQDRYLDLFDAFIEGVEYGRLHPTKVTSGEVQTK